MFDLPKKLFLIFGGIVVLIGVASYFVFMRKPTSTIPTTQQTIPTQVTPPPAINQAPSPSSQELNFILPASLTTAVVMDELRRRGWQKLEDDSTLASLVSLLAKDPKDSDLLKEFGRRYGGPWPSHGATSDDLIRAGRSILFVATDRIEFRDIPSSIRTLIPPGATAFSSDDVFSRQDLNLLISRQIGNIPPVNSFDWVE